jgi:hypothetical protein
MENVEVGAGILIMIMRVLAFGFGLFLLISGLSNYGILGHGDIVAQISAGPLAAIEIPVGSARACWGLVLPRPSGLAYRLRKVKCRMLRCKKKMS